MDFYLATTESQQLPRSSLLLSRAVSEPCSSGGYCAEDPGGPPYKTRRIRSEAIAPATDSPVAAPSVAAPQQPAMAVRINRPDLQSLTDVANADGYAWLKYGEKRISKNTVMRSYYKCSWSRARNPCRATKTVDFDPKRPHLTVVRARCAHNHEAGASCPRPAAARRVPPPLEISRASPSALRARFSANAARETRGAAAGKNCSPVSQQFASTGSEPATRSLWSPMSIDDSPIGPLDAALNAAMSLHSSPASSPLASPLSVGAPSDACDRASERSSTAADTVMGLGESAALRGHVGAEGRQRAMALIRATATSIHSTDMGAGVATCGSGAAACFPVHAATHAAAHITANVTADVTANVTAGADPWGDSNRVAVSAHVSELHTTRMGGLVHADSLAWGGRGGGEQGNLLEHSGVATPAAAPMSAGPAHTPVCDPVRSSACARGAFLTSRCRCNQEARGEEGEWEEEQPSLELSLSAPGTYLGREAVGDAAWGRGLKAWAREVPVPVTKGQAAPAAAPPQPAAPAEAGAEPSQGPVLASTSCVASQAFPSLVESPPDLCMPPLTAATGGDPLGECLDVSLLPPPLPPPQKQHQPCLPPRQPHLLSRLNQPQCQAHQRACFGSREDVDMVGSTSRACVVLAALLLQAAARRTQPPR
ncbi:unnamed protein product [Closterium sp. NIES-53]